MFGFATNSLFQNVSQAYRRIEIIVLSASTFTEILESGSVPTVEAGNGTNSSSSGGNVNPSSSHLSSLSLAYGGSDLPPSLTSSSIPSDRDRKKSITVPPDPSFLDEFRAAGGGGGGGEVKIKPPPPSNSGASTVASGQEAGLCPPDGLLATDSNGSRTSRLAHLLSI